MKRFLVHAQLPLDRADETVMRLFDLDRGGEAAPEGAALWMGAILMRAKGWRSIRGK